MGLSLPELTQIHVLIVPAEEIAFRLERRFVRQSYEFSVRGIVFVAVLKLFFDPPTHFHSIVRCNRDVSAVKEGVHVLPQQNSVLDIVRPLHREWFYVRCVQHVQNG